VNAARDTRALAQNHAARPVLQPRQTGTGNGELTSRERRIQRAAELGYSNKAIAHALGLSLSTVATLLARARRKLGGGVRLLRMLTAPAVERDPIAALTPAERAVAELAVRGLSNAAIARKRRSSPRTVANQLATIYKKLGLGGRRELRARMGPYERRDSRCAPR
jgi:DNA-binding NarL/FixJ family response regulator